jgi:exonuclease III
VRIVSWNCNGALRRKLDKLTALNADVYVIQECEDPERSSDSAYRQWASGSLWIGGNKNKGLGVFSKGVRLSALDWPRDNLELFLPFTVDEHLTMLAVWTRQANSPNFRYIGQLWKYLQAHGAKIPSHGSLVIGDFNSNARWDEWDRWWNHSDVVRDLSEIGLESVYHLRNQEAHGGEVQPTFFMHRKIEKPYHIDYAFATGDLIASARISVGHPEDWLDLSDHMPIVVDFALA